MQGGGGGAQPITRPLPSPEAAQTGAERKIPRLKGKKDIARTTKPINSQGKVNPYPGDKPCPCRNNNDRRLFASLMKTLCGRVAPSPALPPHRYGLVSIL